MKQIMNIGNCHIHSLLMAVLLAVASYIPSQAAPTTVSAKLSQPVITMGDKTTLLLQVVADRGAKGHFPIFEGADPKQGYTTVLGDTIELGLDMKEKSMDLGSGRVQTDYVVPVQAFDSGYYYLPPIAYVVGADTVVSNRVALKVVPVAAGVDDKIADFTDVTANDESSFWDFLPQWVVDYGWYILAGLIVVLAVIYFAVFRRRNPIAALVGKKTLPPYQEAMQMLQTLKAKELWQKGFTKQYYTELIDILRHYIYRRFSISAPEMTSTQILAEFKKHKRLAPYKDRFMDVLSVADFAKFANAQADADSNAHAFNEVLKFVEETKPTAQELKEEKEKKRAAGSQPASTSGKKAPLKSKYKSNNTSTRRSRSKGHSRKEAKS